MTHNTQLLSNGQLIHKWILKHDKTLQSINDPGSPYYQPPAAVPVWGFVGEYGVPAVWPAASGWSSQQGGKDFWTYPASVPVRRHAGASRYWQPQIDAETSTVTRVAPYAGILDDAVSFLNTTSTQFSASAAGDYMTHCRQYSGTEYMYLLKNDGNGGVENLTITSGAQNNRLLSTPSDPGTWRDICINEQLVACKVLRTSSTQVRIVSGKYVDNMDGTFTRMYGDNQLLSVPSVDTPLGVESILMTSIQGSNRFAAIVNPASAGNRHIISFNIDPTTLEISEHRSDSISAHIPQELCRCSQDKLILLVDEPSGSGDANATIRRLAWNGTQYIQDGAIEIGLVESTQTYALGAKLLASVRVSSSLIRIYNFDDIANSFDYTTFDVTPGDCGLDTISGTGYLKMIGEEHCLLICAGTIAGATNLSLAPMKLRHIPI